MGRNLTNLPISASFQYLLQKSGSEVNDGFGADVDYLNISASYAYTASVADTAGSATTASYVAGANVDGTVASATSASYAGNGGVTSIIAGTNITISPIGGTGDVTINAAGGGTVDTGSFYISSSVIDAEITFTQGDGTTESVVVNNVSSSISASHALQADNATTATSASHAVSADSATSASFATTASFAVTASTVVGGVALSAVLNEGNVATNDIILTGSYLRHSASFSGNVIDNITDTYASSERVDHVVSLTQAEYNALTPANDTFYIITDALIPMVTGSVSGNVLTFTKDDGTTFDLTVATGSAVTTPTGSLLTTASAVDATITFTKGDGSTFPVEINNVSSSISASHAIQADNAISSSHALIANVASFAATSTSASHALQADSALTATTATTATTASYVLGSNVDGAVATATSASHAIQADTATSSSYALTASYVEGVGVTPTLQQVTDAGNITTNQLILTGSGVYVSSSGQPSSNFNFETEYNGTRGIILNSTALHDRLSLYGTGKEASIYMFGNDNKISTTTNSDIEIGDLAGTGKIITRNISASGYISASEFIGDGSKLENLPAGDPFPYTGSAQITGSLGVTGSVEIDGSLTIDGQALGNVGTIGIVSSTGSMDVSTANFFSLSLASGVDTQLDATNITSGKGQTITLFIRQDLTTAGTISFSPDFLFAGGTPFTVSTGLGAKDVMTFVSDGSSLFATGLKNFS